MSTSRYQRYQPDALALLKKARELAILRGAKECTSLDVLSATLSIAPPVLELVLAANGLSLVEAPNNQLARSSGEKVDKAATLLLASDLRGALDSAEAESGPFRVSSWHLFSAIWPQVRQEFALCVRKNGDVVAADTLKFPDGTHRQPESKPQKLPRPFADFGRVMGTEPMREMVGREREIASLVSVLVKFLKPNPILLGEPGVGKTALVEQLAVMLREGKAPKQLAGKQIIEISATSLLAGASHHGELEARVEALIKAAEKDGDVILFIDEIHTLVGAGVNSGKAGGVSDQLKPALARGRLRLIGATTNSEYQRYFARDEAFARRFQLVQMDEPERQAVVDILRSACTAIGEHHGVSVEPALFRTIFELCAEALPSRRFPDKALDVLDRACSVAGLAGKTALSSVEVEAAVAELAGLPFTASSPEFLTRLKKLESFLAGRVMGQVGAVRAVANVVRLCKHKLDPRPHRPDGVLLFVGPTGVGKTSMATALAEALCGRPDAVIRLDMNEFSAAGSVTRLLGADPGYIGHDGETALVRGLQTWQTGVLLLDELEKAHPEVQKLFLSAFDEGVIRDAKGNRHMLSNITVIATSNAQPQTSRAMGFAPPNMRVPVEDASLRPADLTHVFPAELLNRFDEIVVFRPLGHSQVLEILNEQLLADFNRKTTKEKGLEVILDEGLTERIINSADFDRFGARELQRVFLRLVIHPLMNLLEQNQIGPEMVCRDGLKVRRVR
jgi:ATP-dependent Clp protease ATP-binding subunit ClpC